MRERVPRVEAAALVQHLVVLLLPVLAPLRRLRLLRPQLSQRTFNISETGLQPWLSVYLPICSRGNDRRIFLQSRKESDMIATVATVPWTHY